MRTVFTIYLALVWLLVPHPFGLLLFALSFLAGRPITAMERMPEGFIELGNRSDGGLCPKTTGDGCRMRMSASSNSMNPARRFQ
jgi:hypothetical protein